MRRCEIERTMLGLTESLFPLHRSMTGDGVRKTFDQLKKVIPITVHEVPTGTTVFDWTVPQEWHIRDAYIKNSSGKRLVDYAQSNLHVVNNSMPVNAFIKWSSLEPHIHSLPDRPEAIPYRTAYFRKDWGFCVPHSLRSSMKASDETFHVYIDSEQFDGSLSYAEYTIPGKSERSVLIYCHTCHPSLANDNLSGIVVAALLAQSLQRKTNQLTYRFTFQLVYRNQFIDGVTHRFGKPQ